ncbi:MAG TPA: DUF2254 domain-containing protein [Casimicrobiaceae bacterium]|nr:DUF2254 domain-containing protein [Casimicrobiaceae bacterium]
MHRLRSVVVALRGSLWFLPALMIAGAIALAVAVTEADLAFAEWAATRWPRFFGATPEGARAVLGSIAAAMATVTGIVFSMTLVTLSLAASHYGSRVMRQFMRDRLNQVVLGTFLGVFAYCLVVARTVRSGDAPFAPALGVTIAILLTFVAIGCLIYFLHHVATSVQATQILATLAHETLQTAERGARRDEAFASAGADDAVPTAWHPVPARTSGFVQTVGEASLASLAHERDVVIRVLATAGDFVVESIALAAVAGPAPDDDLIGRINACYAIGPERSIDDDVGYGLRQIVDIALRALSPGVNDPTTAVLCLHWLTVILGRAAARPQRLVQRRDEAGRLRLVARRATFDTLLRTSFDQIATAARGDTVVLGQVASALAHVAACCATAEARASVESLAVSLHARAGRDVAAPDERRDLQKRLRGVATGERRPTTAPLQRPGDIDAA